MGLFGDSKLRGWEREENFRYCRAVFGIMGLIDTGAEEFNSTVAEAGGIVLEALPDLVTSANHLETSVKVAIDRLEALAPVPDGASRHYDSFWTNTNEYGEWVQSVQSMLQALHDGLVADSKIDRANQLQKKFDSSNQKCSGELKKLLGRLDASNDELHELIAIERISRYSADLLLAMKDSETREQSTGRANSEYNRQTNHEVEEPSALSIMPIGTFADDPINAAFDNYICRQCGKEVSGEWSFCPYCGGKPLVPKEYRCPNCGVELNKDWKVCPKCGLELSIVDWGPTYCPLCGKAIPPNATACPYCGIGLNINSPEA